MQNYLKRIRKRRGVTLADLAKSTGLSIGTIGNFETGARGIGSEALEKIAQALCITVAEILQEPAETGYVREACGLRTGETADDLKARIAELEAALAAANGTIHNLSIALAQGRAPAVPAAGVRYGGTASKPAERKAAG